MQSLSLWQLGACNVKLQGSPVRGVIPGSHLDEEKVTQGATGAAEKPNFCMRLLVFRRELAPAGWEVVGKNRSIFPSWNQQGFRPLRYFPAAKPLRSLREHAWLAQDPPRRFQGPRHLQDYAGHVPLKPCSPAFAQRRKEAPVLGPVLSPEF